jgi:uncharacterized protein (DUF1800 family)
MGRDKTADAALALHRFGVGPRIGSIGEIASDPAGALLAELDRPGIGLISHPGLLGTGEAARAAFDFRQERQAVRLATPPASEMAQETYAMGARSAPGGASDLQARAKTGSPAASLSEAQKPNIPQELYLEEAKARINAALGADVGFVERLVWFWSNHFCISADKGGGVRALCGAYEREAIRTHVLGTFADMLLAVESHPAMLLYLDNARSIGPNSIAGRNWHRGLNENLAREILELHTLGVRTVYSQADVTSFAKVITGWTVIAFKQDSGRGGEFTFNPRMHEPGPQIVLGRSYSQPGFDQGRAVLGDLARHPASAKHIAGKLARYFVADDPAPALVDRLTKQWLETQGDLKAVARMLITAPEAWAAPRSKLKRPGEWITAALRATGLTPSDIRPIISAYTMLGEPLWRPPAPKGFAEESAAWMEGLSERLDVATQLAGRVAGLIDPQAVVETALGPLVSQETRQAVARAESRKQALTLLLMAPEFQRS